MTKAQYMSKCANQNSLAKQSYRKLSLIITFMHNYLIISITLSVKIELSSVLSKANHLEVMASSSGLLFSFQQVVKEPHGKMQHSTHKQLFTQSHIKFNHCSV